MQTMALLAIVALAQVGQTQDYPAKMTISMPEVEVRSGATTSYYVTSKLHAGESVVVLGKSKDAPDWYMILPPAGSFSWLNAKFVKQVDANVGYVKDDGAKLRPGSIVDTKPPDCETIGLDKGSIVSILGPPVNSADGSNTWLRIQPWYTKESRFIPAEAVQGRQQFASNTPNNVPAQFASRSLQSPWNAGPPTQTASFSQSSAAGKTYPPNWSPIGILRRVTPTAANGQASYVLEDTKRNVLQYVNTQPGYTLQGYINRTVSLYGSYRSDDAVRPFVMQATNVALYSN